MIEQRVASLPQVFVRQKKELLELIGFETRNQYSIESESGEILAYAAEESKGFFGALFRQALGHWRSFAVHLYGATQEEEFTFEHPFRFYFERVEVRRRNGERLGSIERRFSIFSKKFDVEDAQGRLLMTVSSPIWKIWTFRFFKDGQECARITKKWSGIGREMFLDADNFLVQFNSPSLGITEKILLIGAAVFIDIRYFEKKGSGGAFSISDFFRSE